VRRIVVLQRNVRHVRDIGASGIVDHRDSVLTPDERAVNNTLMICVSQAASPRLVLHL